MRCAVRRNNRDTAAVSSARLTRARASLSHSIIPSHTRKRDEHMLQICLRQVEGAHEVHDDRSRASSSRGGRSSRWPLRPRCHRSVCVLEVRAVCAACCCVGHVCLCERCASAQWCACGSARPSFLRRASARPANRTPAMRYATARAVCNNHLIQWMHGSLSLLALQTTPLHSTPIVTQPSQPQSAAQPPRHSAQSPWARIRQRRNSKHCRRSRSMTQKQHSRVSRHKKERHARAKCSAAQCAGLGVCRTVLNSHRPAPLSSCRSVFLVQASLSRWCSAAAKSVRTCLTWWRICGG